MNTPHKSTEPQPILDSPYPRVGSDDTLETVTWFAPHTMRPGSARPKSVPPTGDDEIDRWLR